MFGLDQPGLLTVPPKTIPETVTGPALDLMESNAAQLAPLFTMLAASKITPDLTEPVIRWNDQKTISRMNSLIDNMGNPTGATFKIAHPGMVQVNSFLRINSTSELMRVTQVTGNIITVNRNLGGYGPVPAINCNPAAQVNFTDMGHTSQPLGSGRVHSVQFGTNSNLNYLSTIVTGMQMDGQTKTILMNKDKAGHPQGYKYMLNRIVVEHMQTIERAILFNKRFKFTNGTETVTGMNGILNSIKTNIASPIGGTLYSSQLSHFLDTTIRRAGNGATPSDYLILMNPSLRSLINNAATESGQYTYTAADNFYGIQLHKWVTPNHTFTLFEHPMLDSSGLTGDIIMLHKEDIQLYSIREAQDDTDVLQEAGYDMAFKGMLSEYSLGFRNEWKSARMSGVCNFVIPPRKVYQVESMPATTRVAC